MVDKDKMELVRKIGVFGLSDLRKLAPIGNIGYENDWYPPFGSSSWMNGGMERAILKAYYQQSKEYGFKTEGYSSGCYGTDHHSYCKQLGLSWAVDSSG